MISERCTEANGVVTVHFLLAANAETYSEPCKTSKMELFTKIGNGFQRLTIPVKKNPS